jgi:transposase
MKTIPVATSKKSASISDLETENYELKKQISAFNLQVEFLQKQNSVLVSQLEIMQHNLGILQRAIFGKKSEKSSEENIEQLKLLFDEAEAGAEPQSELDLGEEDNETEPFTKPRNKPGRKPLPANLPRKQIIHDLPEAQKICPCGCTLTLIGEDKSEQLDYIPATLQVIENIRLKYACKACEDTVKRAAVPVKPLPKANATAGLLAQIIVSKFADHLPLYRQSMIWERLGVDIGRGTLCNWVLGCGRLLQPLVEAMQKDIVAATYVCSDETTVNVLDDAASKSYMWVHMSGDRARRAVVFDYHGDRTGECATTFLNGFSGAHQCDAYSGYNELHQKTGVFHVACWAHARRKFFDITKIVKTQGLAHQMVALIKKLYKIEREALDKDMEPLQIKTLRMEKSVPILADIKILLDDYKDKVPPKSPLGLAINYTLNQWDGLNTYLQDGRLRIDNNDCERAIRPFAIGRKNWLFSATTNGAQASATLFSLIATCKANGINAYGYLRYVLTAIKTASTEAELHVLLPYNIDKTLVSV